MTASTRDKIYHTALHLFVDKGFSASVDQLVSDTGIAKGTFYHYFKSKEYLIIALYKKLMFEIEAECVKDFEDERVLLCSREVFRSIVQWFILNPVKFRYITVFETSPFKNTELENVDEVMEGPRRIIMQKVNMGLLKANPPDMIAFHDFAFTRAAANYFLSFSNPPEHFVQQFDAAFDMYWDGVSNK